MNKGQGEHHSLAPFLLRQTPPLGIHRDIFLVAVLRRICDHYIFNNIIPLDVMLSSDSSSFFCFYRSIDFKAQCMYYNPESISNLQLLEAIFNPSEFLI